MVSLPPNLTSLVQSRIEAGFYQTEEEVLSAALDALAERERQADLASIRRGLDDLEAGRCRSVEESEAECRRRLGMDEEL